MKVLDHEHDRFGVGQRLEQCQQRLEDARLGRVAGGAALAEAGQDRVERGAQRRRERVESRVALADERAERTQERCVWKLVIAKLHAVAREHAGARIAGVTLELVREARLPDSGFTANQGERRPGFGRVS